MTVSVEQKSRGAIRVASPWVEWLARLGFAAKGVVYALVGVFAVMYALGEGGQTGGSRDALQRIAGEPFGQILLVIIALGLVGYSVWLFIRSGLDTEGEGSDTKGAVKRVGYAVNGVVYLGLAFVAARLAFGSGGGGGSGSAQDWTAWLMSQLNLFSRESNSLYETTPWNEKFWPSPPSLSRPL